MVPLLRTLGVAILVLIAADPAGSQSFMEDFSTTAYKDAVVTTAWWDTGTGALRLHSWDIAHVGTYATPAAARDVAVAGDLAYVTVAASGIRIVDITDPSSPVYAGAYNPGGSAWGIDVDGHVAFVTTDNLVRAVGVANPAMPVPMGSYVSPTTAYGIEVVGPYAYVADGTAGLLILNVSDPTNITLAGSFDTAGSAIDVVVAGDLAFVADRGAGLTIVDISDPSAPAFVGNYDTPGDTWGIAVDGDLAFLGDAGPGVHVVDITSPSFPTLVATYDTPSSARGVCVAGDYLYVADYGSVHAIDVSNPSAPALEDSYETPGIASKVVLAGEYAFVADGAAGGLQILKVCDAVAPPYIALSGGLTSFGADFAVPVGNHMYVGNQGVGLQVFDISDIDVRVLAGTFPALTPVDLAVDGDLAYGVGEDGLTVLGIQNPVVPVVLGSSGLVQSGSAVVADGDYVYVLDDASGAPYELSIFSVANPAVPVRLGGCNFSPSWDAAEDVAVQGSYAYVAAGAGGLQVVNIVVPSNPYVVATRTVGVASGIAVDGNTLVVAAGTLWIFDVTNPADPTLVTEYTPSIGLPGSVEISGDILFVGTTSGAGLVDISDRSFPTSRSFAVVGNVTDMRLAGDFLFSSMPSSYGWYILSAFQRRFDMSRNVGQSLRFAQTSEDVTAVRVTPTASGNWIDYTYRLSADDGAIWNAVIPNAWTTLSFPGNRLVWRCYLRYSLTVPLLNDILIEWAFTASDADELSAELAGYALLPVAPNPSPTGTTVRFALPRQELVRLYLYDVSGRKVATLAEGIHGAGITEVAWDGRANDGRAVPSGTYFVRLRAGDYEAARKIVLQH